MLLTYYAMIPLVCFYYQFYSFAAIGRCIYSISFGEMWKTTLSRTIWCANQTRRKPSQFSTLSLPSPPEVQLKANNTEIENDSKLEENGPSALAQAPS